MAVKPGQFIIAVYASQIHKRLLEPNAPPALPQSQETVRSGDATGAANAAAIEAEPSTHRGENDVTGRAASAVQNRSVEMVGTVEDVGDPLTIRSREKSDRWHEHDNVPLPKDCPASPFVHQLLRHAAYAMNSAEYERVRATLAAKGIHDADSHFFFNRRYWMKRVRMPPRESDEASANLLSVLDFLKREDAFKEYVTEDFEKHVRGWARRCREGRYEDLPDVEMYTHDGCDSDGLDLWISRRGSKGENFHQKMRVAVGPFGISVETAHYVHVILAYLYLVSAGVNRCNEPDFGHFLLHLEDRIQGRMRDLWEVDLFTNRVNLSEHERVDFVAVGVGPLSHDSKYVAVLGPGERPAEGMSKDLQFMAKRMRVTIPPLPPSSPQEFAMIKTFCSQSPQPKEADIQRLCRTFKAQSNGTTIFPKLPSLVKPAIKRWKLNQKIELLRLQSGDAYKQFFESLRNQMVSLPEPERINPLPLPAQQPSQQNSEESEEPAPTLLSRPRVPPASAPSQSSIVPAAKVGDGKCFYYPKCKSNRSECGGGETTCRFYCKDGIHPTPTREELDYELRLVTWSEGKKKQNCAWFPFCDEKAVRCGGRVRDECSKYGVGGTHRDERPSNDELSRSRNDARAQKAREKRRKKT